MTMVKRKFGSLGNHQIILSYYVYVLINNKYIINMMQENSYSTTANFIKWKISLFSVMWFMVITSVKPGDPYLWNIKLESSTRSTIRHNCTFRHN